MLRKGTGVLAALGGAAAIGLCVGAPAHAGQEEQSGTFTQNNLGGPDVVIPIQLFDDQGGCRVLTKVTLTIESQAVADLEFCNDNTLDPCTGNVTTTATTNADLGGIIFCPPGGQSNTQPIDNLLPGQCIVVPGFLDFAFDCMDQALDPSLFVGPGTLDLTFSSEQDTDAVVDCDFTLILNTQWEGTWSVVYEFDELQLDCMIDGPLSLCPGDQDVRYDLLDGAGQPLPPGLDIDWMITGDAVFCVAPEGDNVLVCADNVCGSFMLTATVSDPNFPDCPPATCELLVLLEDDELPMLDCPTSPQMVDCPGSLTFPVTVTDNCGKVTLVFDAIFNPPASGTFTDNDDGTYTISFTETGSATVTFTATDSCGNIAECVIEFNSECVDGGEGCTPGYWKQPHHFDSWPPPYTPDTLFCDVFFGDFPGDECAFEGLTLHDVLSQPASADPGPNQLNSLGRHTVAALLNAASPGVAYDFTVQEVIDEFNAVYPGSIMDYNDLKAEFSAANEAGCPLNGNADANADGLVNVLDLLVLLNNWGTSGPAGDLNQDGFVNVSDFLVLVMWWGA